MSWYAGHGKLLEHFIALHVREHYKAEGGALGQKAATNSSTEVKPFKTLEQGRALHLSAGVLSFKVSLLQGGAHYRVCVPFMTG